MPTVDAKESDAPKPKSPAFFPAMNPQARQQEPPKGGAPPASGGPSATEKPASAGSGAATSNPSAAPANGAKADAPAAAQPSSSGSPSPASGGAEAKQNSAARGIERLLADVKRDFDRTVDAELKRLENEFGDIVDALSRQLIEARESVGKLSEETSMLRKENADYQKKSKLLKELQEKLKDI